MKLSRVVHEEGRDLGIRSIKGIVEARGESRLYREGGKVGVIGCGCSGEKEGVRILDVLLLSKDLGNILVNYCK